MRVVVISASSDIGHDLAGRWAERGEKVVGTFRTPSDKVRELGTRGVEVLRCDLARGGSMARFSAGVASWDVLLFCPATMEPIGPFRTVSFARWKESVEINFVSQMHLLHRLLGKRNRRFPNGPVVIFFAGGGTNSAPVNYSAYTASKIALIKMVELLDAEIPDTRFSIVGPGWVDTKIHRETLRAGERAGRNYGATIRKLDDPDGMTPTESIFECCDWIVRSPREVVSGRNFSVVFDRWGKKDLETRLRNDPDMYKLRRHKN